MTRRLVLLSVMAISGCGTLQSVGNPTAAADDLAAWQSNCRSIPRTYSGVAYRFCSLDAPQRTDLVWSAPAVVVDLVLSGVADTLLLPYTGYQQATQGAIDVKRRR